MPNVKINLLYALPRFSQQLLGYFQPVFGYVNLKRFTDSGFNATSKIARTKTKTSRYLIKTQRPSLVHFQPILHHHNL